MICVVWVPEPRQLIFFYSWFQSVTLANRAPGGSITAWAGTPGTTNGVYIVDSKIIRVSSQCCDGVPDVRYLVTVARFNRYDRWKLLPW